MDTKELKVYDWLGMKELTAILGVNERTVRTYIERYGLPAYKLGGQLKFSQTEIDEWVKQQKVTKA